MKILAIECSATPCSVAVIEDGKIISSAFVNVKLTHSQTLMPMVEDVLKSAMLSIAEIDGLAVSEGPGSFTGIRIGISAIKGIGAVRKLPCVGVSTLKAMAQNYADTNCIVCSVMDARCNQVYNALFDIEDGVITRLCEDRALLCDELAEEIKKISQNGEKSVIIIGDGAEVFYPFVKELDNVIMAHSDKRYQNAIGVAFEAQSAFYSGETVSPNELLPVYLRLPQAERELKNKKEQGK